LPLCLSLTLFSFASRKSPEALLFVVAEGPLEYVLEDISGTVLVQSAERTQPEQAGGKRTSPMRTGSSTAPGKQANGFSSKPG
jgi:hypothetical protein